jgi:hypothetical protein
MCQAIRFTINDHLITVKLTDSNPCVPVIMRSGNIMLMPWGNPSGLIPLFPPGGTLHRDHVIQGKWKAFEPKPIKILCQSYMLTDSSGNECWINCTDKNQLGIKGATATVWKSERAYILIRQPEILDPIEHTGWPIQIGFSNYINPKNSK